MGVIRVMQGFSRAFATKVATVVKRVASAATLNVDDSFQSFERRRVARGLGII